MQIGGKFRAIALAGLALSMCGTASAGALAFNLSASTDIWLAGQPDGTTATGFFGADTAPADSPYLVSVSSGQVLIFTAAGLTSVDTSCFAGPDGGCYPDETPFGTAAANGIGSYQGPADALIGVFLDNSTPSGTGGPTSLDFTDPSVISQASFAPLLNQIFFIGDGFTGTGSGTQQQFTVPTGATRLFLAVADSFGSSDGNPGSLDVTVDTTAPEPASFALVGLAGLALAAFAISSQRSAISQTGPADR
jgi:hypothetical protein